MTMDDRTRRLDMVTTQLAARGVRDARVLEAMREVPRHLFVPESARHEAYDDRPLPIGEAQTISQPYMVAVMTQALAPLEADRVLEIGTGSGYQTAILARLAGSVVSIERHAALAARARTVLDSLGITNVDIHVGDGTEGWPDDAPFDRILVTAGAPNVPESLRQQLADGGRLVIPVGASGFQHVTIVDRHGDQYTERQGDACVFVPLIGRLGWPNSLPERAAVRPPERPESASQAQACKQLSRRYFPVGNQDNCQYMDGGVEFCIIFPSHSAVSCINDGLNRPSCPTRPTRDGNVMTIKKRNRVLAIDDEPSMIEWLKILLEHEGYEVRTAMIGTRGEEIFKTWKPDVVVTDMMLPDADGLELLRKFKQIHADTEVIVVTGHGSVVKAVEAMKAGAHSFVEKPIEPDTLLAMLERAIERRDLVGENLLLKQKLEGQFRFGNIIGKSKKMHEVLELVESVAGSDANILIQGENGTGKELIANAIHYNSKRAKGPFIKINCAAIPKDLIESELFGYKKGAFTGAATDREGLFEMSEGGSLLLDEIGEMPPYLQTKLLRVLQEREYRPIGSDRIVRVDFRLICATNIDLDAALRDGKLREDLYFRINTITLRVPPLRERTEDIPLLCEHFLEKYRQRHQRNVKSIAPAAYHVLIRHRWPGNVRELENVIERGVLVAKGSEITVNDLPESLRTESSTTTEFVIPPHRTLAEIEKMAILQTLQRTNWNKQEAAQILGLYRPTLYSKMKKHEIQDGGKGAARRAAPVQ